jgi:hypothetical protein
MEFDVNDPAITEQQAGLVANPDIADQVNTVLKIAKKRALVDAVLLAVNASEFFTQDIEDFIIQPVADMASLRTILKSARELLGAMGGELPKLTLAEVRAMSADELLQEILATHRAARDHIVA